MSAPSKLDHFPTQWMQLIQSVGNGKTVRVKTANPSQAARLRWTFYQCRKLMRLQSPAEMVATAEGIEVRIENGVEVVFQNRDTNEVAMLLSKALKEAN